MNPEQNPDRDTKMTQGSVRCPVCGQSLAIRLARGRRSGKPFVMMLCAVDGRHFRAFISDENYVRGVIGRLEGQIQASGSADDVGHGQGGQRRSRTKLERGE